MVQVLIEGKPFNLEQGQLSSNLTPTDGLEVAFLRVGGQPQQVRPVGQDFVPPRTAQPSRAVHKHSAKESAQHHSEPAVPRSPQMQTQASGQHAIQDERPRDFHNPYNFIPAPPRKSDRTDHPDLGDGPPVPHDAFDPERYSGRIRVRMIVKTPILVPDTDPANVQEDNNGHKTFRLRVDESGLPSIPASSVRGMLRSAYEAITNSRFGRFSSGHKTKIQYREAQSPFRKVDFPASPWDLLHPTLHPAASIDELSPADRVFGWVRADAASPSCGSQSDCVAARGCLRVGPILCESERAVAVETFASPGLPLAILAAPKPQQGRFYVAKNQDGDAQDQSLTKEQAGYSEYSDKEKKVKKSLRGRKMYPHHCHLTQGVVPDDYWMSTPVGGDPSQEKLSESGREYFREHIRPIPTKPDKLQRDDQNRSILGWVKPGAVFTFDVHVQNLSKVELGALLWLLTLPEEHYYRLGGGKPLGFGGVRLTIDECDVRTGNDLRNRYMAWHPEPLPADPTEAAVQAFKEALSCVYPASGDSNVFDDISFIKAFLLVCKGFPVALPVHYPRATPDGQPGPPSPDGESFKWFVANEKSEARYALPNLSTPNLSTDTGLPTLRDSQQARGGRGQRRP